MRTTLTVIAGFLAALAIASAQESPARGPGRGRMNVGFAMLDTNGDGVLDAQEIAAAPALLARLDKNSDGQITSNEVRPAIPEGRGRGGREEGGAATNITEDTVKTLMAFDANGDGKLSRSELPERFQGIFDRGDANQDGFLTADEIRKAAAAQAPPADFGGPGERGDGPRGEINFIRIDPVLAAVDANGDGVLSAEEIRNAPEAIRRMDKDGDGKVTREEAMRSGGRGRG